MRLTLLLLWLVHGWAAAQVTLTAVGDIYPVGQGRASSVNCCQEVQRLLSEGEIVIGNLEAPLVEAGVPVAGQVIHHRAAPAAARQLTAFTMLSLANNHAMDYGPTGLQSTVQALEQAGIRALGSQGHESLTLTKNGVTLTFLAFSGGYPLAQAGFPVCVINDPAVMEERVRHFASLGHQVVVVLHWGEEDCEQPLSEQREIAHRLVDAGAALIIGHHPHVLQGIEQYGPAVIVWSLGNFVWPGAAGPHADSAVVRITLSGQGVTDTRAAPVQIVSGRPRPARGPQAEAILARLRLLSRELGSPAEIQDGRLTLGGLEPAGLRIPLGEQSFAELRQGTLTVIDHDQRAWQSPPDRYVLQALPQSVMGSAPPLQRGASPPPSHPPLPGGVSPPPSQLVLLLQTLTAPKHWVTDHFELEGGVRELTQHLALVGQRARSSAWGTLWLSSPLDRTVLEIASGGPGLLQATERDQEGLSRQLYQWTGWAFQEYEDPALFHRRQRMVQEILVPSGITSPEVLEAARRIPRHLFVPPSQQGLAYENRILPIGGEQTIPQPTLMARMAADLELSGRERVLEIGTGSGYQAALLACLAEQVFTVEILPELGASARRAWRRLDLENIHLKIGDGSRGWAEAGPFDAILVTAAPPGIPRALLDQLAEGGRMVIPVGPPRSLKTLWRVRKQRGKLSYQAIGKASVVAMELPHSLELCAPPR